MILYRKNTNIINHKLFSADSLVTYIPWDNIKDLCLSITRSLKNNTISTTNIGTYTDYEVVSLCNIPIKDESDNTMILNKDDVFSDEYIKTKTTKTILIPDNIRECASNIGSSIILREIVMDKKYRIPKPGYRIQTGVGNGNRFIISIIMDEYIEDNIRLVCELTETVIQYILRAIGVADIFYPIMDYNTSDNFESAYTNIGQIPIKDFPSIKDILFKYNYIDTIVDVYVNANERILGAPETRSFDKLYDSYFSDVFLFDEDLNNMQKWCITKDEFDKLVNATTDGIYELAIEEMNRIYFSGDENA